MKEPSQRTKVVIRHLPPSLSQSDLFSQIDARFSDRYDWSAFRPGKYSHKSQKYSRAYIDFKTPEDVFEFAAFFNGHVFVNEKGTQLKSIVEYAPSQRVPKPCAKKDAREGTVYKDPEYLEFLKLIAKPAESLPSAEIQMERKEAEQAGVSKESLIITPLMEFIRQKRATESGYQGSSGVGKMSRRGRAASGSKGGSRSSKRNAEKKKYVEKDSSKNMSRKGKSAYIAIPRLEDRHVTSSGKEMLENETGKISPGGIDGSLPGITLTTESGKKKILLVKPKERDNTHNPQSMSEQQIETSFTENTIVASASRQNQRREAGGRLIKSILLKNDGQQSQSSPSVQPQQKVQLLSLENSKRPPRPVGARAGKDHHGGIVGEKLEKRVRNKDRPDRVVWAPLRHPYVLHTNEEVKDDVSSQRSAEAAISSSGYHSHSTENGSARYGGRRAGGQNRKDDGSVMIGEGKSSRRGGSSSNTHEKQMWVQKSSLGS